MLRILVVASSYFVGTYALTTCSEDFLPCQDGGCPDPKLTCIIEQNTCCPEELMSNNTQTTQTTRTTTTPRTTTKKATACVDLPNPSTGVSDCPKRAYLCNDATYYTLMTQQCPKTCGRCSGGGSAPAPAPTTCADRLNPSTGRSDCPMRANLCNDPTYYTLMTQQCPRTCGRCSGGGTAPAPAPAPTVCADRLNPSTGRSDCPIRANLCNDPTYYTLMTQQCPRTCGRCTSG